MAILRTIIDREYEQIKKKVGSRGKKVLLKIETFEIRKVEERELIHTKKKWENMSEDEISYAICEDCGKSIWREEDAYIGLVTQLCQECAFKRVTGEMTKKKEHETEKEG